MSVDIIEIDTKKVLKFKFIGDPTKHIVTIPLTVLLVECCLDSEKIESIYINEDDSLINMQDMLTVGQADFEKAVTVTIELVFGARLGQPEVMAEDYVAYYDCRSVNMCRTFRAVRAPILFISYVW